MIIDLTAHLRRLVLAGLPLAANACEPTAVVLEPPFTTQQKLLGARCQQRVVQRAEPHPRLLSTSIAFGEADPRFSDLYQSCHGEGRYCGRLCSEVFQAAEVEPTSPNHTVNAASCELGCDTEGRPVARIGYFSESRPVPGRRPQGFLAASCDAAHASVGEFFAAAATMEGASIAAFQILAAELRHHAAPTDLVDRALASARDEARHFRQTARLARSFKHAPVRCPRVQRHAPRDLMTVARENAVEGCVNETFSAVVALHQGHAAIDPSVRQVLAAIAEDELRHAQLAWDVHGWAKARLGEAAVRELDHARADAGRRLLTGAAAPVATALVDHAGLPDAQETMRLATAAQALWS